MISTKKLPNFNSDEEEKYFNIEDDELVEARNMISSRADLFYKSFRPGTIEAKKRGLPNAPGTNRHYMSKRNKPSKKRIKLKDDHISPLSDDALQGDIGGDVGGERYNLYDYEEVKKNIPGTTGATGNVGGMIMSQGIRHGSNQLLVSYYSHNCIESNGTLKTNKL